MLLQTSSKPSASRYTHFWVSMPKGEIVLKREGTEPQRGAALEGKLDSIEVIERTYQGTKVKKWAFTLHDDEALESYTITLPLTSGTAYSILLALSTDTELTKDSVIRLETYRRGNYTNVTTFSNGAELKWAQPTLPEEDKRAEYFDFLARQVNARLKVNRVPNSPRIMIHKPEDQGSAPQPTEAQRIIAEVSKTDPEGANFLKNFKLK